MMYTILGFLLGFFFYDMATYFNWLLRFEERLNRQHMLKEAQGHFYPIEAHHIIRQPRNAEDLIRPYE